MPGQLERLTKRDGVLIEGARVDELRLPLLIYREAVEPIGGKVSAQAATRAARESGWALEWVLARGAAGAPHYHSTTHEAVFVLEGRTRVRYGVDGGLEVELRAGDVAFHPAGCFHEGGGDSERVYTGGAYPVDGAKWDWECDHPDAALIEKMNALPTPPHPVLGGSIDDLAELL